MAGLVGAGITALSLDTIVNTPARWGVNYDQLFGNPFVEADTDIVTPVLGEPGVAKLSAVHLGSLTIDGRDTPTLAVDAVKGDLYPTTLSGRPPTHTDEIGLGEEVARRLHVGIGDQVSVVGATGSGGRACRRHRGYSRLGGWGGVGHVRYLPATSTRPRPGMSCSHGSHRTPRQRWSIASPARTSHPRMRCRYPRACRRCGGCFRPRWLSRSC